MIKLIVIVVLLLITALLLYAATRPDSFRVQRSIGIRAAPEKIFALLNDFHNWADWSPWEKLDPAMKKTWQGASSGVGAVHAWEGNSKVGQGRMEIMEASAPSRLLIKLDFFKPFEAHNMAEYTLEPRGDSTEVTWAMYGPNRYFSKIMGLFFSMDRMVGGQFEDGLARLKVLAERQAGGGA
jgi:hypothetical protein